MNEIQIRKEFFVENIRPSKLFSEANLTFFREKGEEIKKTFEKTWMWRTAGQKRSIINDHNFPTIHSKFHQAMLEQKVQLNETLELSKTYEETLLKQEDLEYQKEGILDEIEKETDELKKKRLDVKLRKIELKIQYKKYEIENQKIACDYRMKEVKDWEAIKESLKSIMIEANMTEEEIYNKETDEVSTQFFTYINTYIGIQGSTNGAEIDNITTSATFAVQQAIDTGMINSLLSQCTEEQIRAIKSLKFNVEVKKHD